MLDIAAIKEERVKITILSGFLGSGKTTLINHIIRQNQESRIAFLVNDFGEINIDKDLIAGREENKIALTGGCICCSIQKDLITAVINLMKQEVKPDHIIVECSGAADPAHVLNSFSAPLFKFHFHVDGLISVIDSSQLLKIDKEYVELAERQIKPANLLILNKVDLIDSKTLERVKDYIIKISPKAVILESIRCQVPVDLILGFKDLPELKGLGELKGLDVHVQKVEKSTVRILPTIHLPVNNEHDLAFESWSFTSKTPFIQKEFKKILETIPPEIIRAKGFVHWNNPANPLVKLNLVGQWLDIDIYLKKEEELITETRLVFIGKPGWKMRFNIENMLNDCLVKEKLSH